MRKGWEGNLHGIQAYEEGLDEQLACSWLRARDFVDNDVGLVDARDRDSCLSRRHGTRYDKSLPCDLNGTISEGGRTDCFMQKGLEGYKIKAHPPLRWYQFKATTKYVVLIMVFTLRSSCHAGFD